MQSPRAESFQTCETSFSEDNVSLAALSRTSSTVEVESAQRGIDRDVEATKEHLDGSGT